MGSRSRNLAKLLDAGGDVKSGALDNVEHVAAPDEVVQSSATSSSTTSFVIDSVSVSGIRAATFGVAASFNDNYHFTTIASALNSQGDDCDYTEFGTLGNSELATYSVEVISGNLRLIATPVSANVQFKTSRVVVGDE